MNIIEVKNNLVKLCYEEDVTLSELIVIKDTHKSYIAQILHLESTRVGKVAVAKIIFNYDGVIHAYDGSIPSLRSVIEPLDFSVLLNTLEHSNPLTLGKIAGKKDNIVVDFNILKDNPIILAEKFFTTKVLLNNFALQLQARKEKLVVFDTMGVFKTNKLTVTKDFRLPLNNSTINYIYEKGFEDATAESKAMIQAIFEELGEYSKTVEFIPFDTFKAVVDSEFARTKLMQLIILKNKIKQIRDWNVFAQQEEEFKTLAKKLENESTIVLDISCLKESLQKECIKYVYSVLNKINSEFYVFTPITTENSDKFLLQQIFDTENVHTSLICDYGYSNLSELKKRSKNMLMFTPLKQQKDFGGYNIFLQKLAEDEFIAYGKMTKFVPLIGKLFQMTSEDAYIPHVKESITNIQQAVMSSPEVAQVVPEEIIQATSSGDLPEENPEPVQNEAVEESDEDINESVTLPDNHNQETAENTQDTEAENIIDKPEQEESAEQIQAEETVVDDIVENITGDNVEEDEIIQEHSIETEIVTAPEVQEIEAPEIETVTTQDIQIAQMAGASAESIQPVTAEPDTEEVPEYEQVQEQHEAEPSGDVQAALDEVPEIEDEELSDDDLDMIEELSKPDEEIPAINPDYEPVEVPQEEIVQEPVSQVQEEEPEDITQPETIPAEETNPMDEEINNATMPRPSETLETRAKTTPSIPEYSAEFPDEDKVDSDVIQQGDRVFHQEFGEGVVEKMINYGDKILCSVNFANVGRRLLNPEISEMKKI